MKKIIALLMMLFFAVQCFGATLYVDPSVDGPGTGTQVDPYKVLQTAITNASTGDTIKLVQGTYDDTTQGANFALTFAAAKTLTIEPATTDVTLTFGAATTAITYNLNDPTKIITFNHIVLDSDLCTYALRNPTPPKDFQGVFNYCTFNHNDTGSSTAFFFYDNAAYPGLRLTFNNCTITVPSPHTSYGAMRFGKIDRVIYRNCTIAVTGAEVWNLDEDINYMEVNNCTTTQTIASGTYAFFNGSVVNNDSNQIRIINSTFENDSTGQVCLNLDQTFKSFKHLQVKGCNFTNTRASVYITDLVQAGLISIEDNNVYSTKGGNGFHIGNNDYDAAPTYEINNVHLWNNTITKSTTAGHGMMVGTNVTNCDIGWNTVTQNRTTLDWGYVIKAEGVNFHHNIGYGLSPLYLNGCKNSAVFNNTMYATSGYALSWDNASAEAGGDGPDGSNNRVYNNIFTASGTADVLYDGATNEHWDFWLDYNCYWSSDHYFYIGGSYYDTLATIRAKWQTFTNFWFDNDSHSIIADPQIRSVSGGDYRLKRESPCINTGKPTLSSGYSNMGAVAPDSTTGNQQYGGNTNVLYEENR